MGEERRNLENLPCGWFRVTAHERLLRLPEQFASVKAAVMVDKHKVQRKSLQSSINRAQIRAKAILQPEAHVKNKLTGNSAHAC